MIPSCFSGLGGNAPKKNPAKFPPGNSAAGERQLSSLSVKPCAPKVDEWFDLKVGSLVPNSEVCLQLSLRSPASSDPFLSSKLHLKVSPDGTATFPNTMDVLSRMEGKGRFYVNGSIDNNLEYTVTVEGVGSTMWKRGVYGDDVSRVEVGGGKPGQVQGTLFLPSEPGPGVLCLAGVGGVREDTAAFLAGKGFTTLALAYFGTAGLSRFEFF